MRFYVFWLFVSFLIGIYNDNIVDWIYKHRGQDIPNRTEWDFIRVQIVNTEYAAEFMGLYEFWFFASVLQFSHQLLLNVLLRLLYISSSF